MWQRRRRPPHSGPSSLPGYPSIPEKVPSSPGLAGPLRLVGPGNRFLFQGLEWPAFVLLEPRGPTRPTVPMQPASFHQCDMAWKPDDLLRWRLVLLLLCVVLPLVRVVQPLFSGPMLPRETSDDHNPIFPRPMIIVILSFERGRKIWLNTAALLLKLSLTSR